MKKILFCCFIVFSFIFLADPATAQRTTEKMDRGIIALNTPDGAYISWRLLRSDPKDVAFDVFRFDDKGNKKKLNAKPITCTTDFLDTSIPEKSGNISYGVAVTGMDKCEKTDLVTHKEGGLPYISIPLQNKKTRFGKIAIADLNGDGKFDYVIKHPASTIDPWYKYWQPSTDTYKLEAYTHDGQHLWTRDLGWAIECGIWYSPYLVADLDGDGKAEIAVKTGEGNPRGKDGKVKQGKECLSIWDGMTGKTITKAPWPSRDGFMKMKSGYNYASRNQLAAAYLDGKKLSVVALRGTYNLMKADAYDLKDGKLHKRWSFNNKGMAKKYWGQGEHFTHAVDVDNDGKDEVMLGSVMLDDNGQPLWTTGLGHNDAGYVADIDPTRPGLEIYYIIETRKKKNGMCLVDAKTGKIIWGYDKPTRHIHSAGMCADIDPLHLGNECYGADSGNHKLVNGPWLWSAKGKLLAFGQPVLPKSFDIKTVFWDADLQKECIFNGQPTDYQGMPVDQRGAGKLITVADIYGDWREEVITSAPGEIRIYSTTIPASDRRVCLFQDPIYRADVRMNSMGYAKVPSLSYCPAALVPNLNLTIMKDKGEPYCRVVVTAPLNKGIKGHMQIACREAQMDSKKFKLNLKPGEIKVWRLPIKMNDVKTVDRNVYVKAQLNVDGIIINGRVPIQLKKITVDPFKPKGFYVEAENFSAQGSGSVKIRSDKDFVSNKAISHWDDKGHWLEWTIKIPKSGRYKFFARYCSSSDAQRALILDGKKMGTVTLKSTGGFGNNRYDWQQQTILPVKAGEGIELSAGTHQLRMINIDGKPLNLDVITFQNSSEVH